MTNTLTTTHQKQQRNHPEQLRKNTVHILNFINIHRVVDNQPVPTRNNAEKGSYQTNNHTIQAPNSQRHNYNKTLTRKKTGTPQ